MRNEQKQLFAPPAPAIAIPKSKSYYFTVAALLMLFVGLPIAIFTGAFGFFFILAIGLLFIGSVGNSPKKEPLSPRS
jgi:hypothetical protein